MIYNEDYMDINVTYIRLIKNILENDLDSRDDWMLCIKTIHNWQMIKNNILKEQYFEKLFEKNSGKYFFMNVDTIKRVWAKVQEDNINLRGLLWAERQIQGGQYNIISMTNQLSLFTKEQLDEFAKIDFSKF